MAKPTTAPRFTVPQLNALVELAAAQMTPDQMEEFAKAAARISVKANGEPHTLRNRFLMWVQDGDVSDIAGFDQWKKHGRKVRKGGKGLAIIAPRTRSAKGKDQEQDEAITLQGEDSKKRVVVGMKVTYVYPISQTEPITDAEQTLPATTSDEPDTVEIQEMLDAILASEDDAEMDEAA